MRVSKGKTLPPRETPTRTPPTSTDLFPDLKPLETPDEVNDFLSRLILLIAQGRISTRRASVISYSSSLILYGLTVNDKLIVARQPLIFDWTRDPRLASSSNANPRETNAEDPVSSHAQTHADSSASGAPGPTVAPTTPLEALRTYEQLRT